MTDSQKLDLLLTEMQEMKSEMQGMKGEMQGMKSHIQGLEKKVTSLEVHIENVTDRNITFIAEGHLDLSRKLDDALKAEQLKEWYYIRTNVMDDEIRKIKERLAETA